MAWDVVREFWPEITRKFRLPFRTHNDHPYAGNLPASHEQVKPPRSMILSKNIRNELLFNGGFHHRLVLIIAAAGLTCSWDAGRLPRKDDRCGCGNGSLNLRVTPARLTHHVPRHIIWPRKADVVRRGAESSAIAGMIQVAQSAGTGDGEPFRII